VVTDPSQYDAVANELAAHDGCTTLELRRSLAREAFRATASYDTAISAWFGRTQDTEFPPVLEGRWVRCEELRYGENPHQRAAVYRDPDPREASVVGAPLLHGKPLSYNNLLDAAAALELVRDLYDIDPSAHACAVIKHTNPCGAAIAGSAREAFDRAYGGDPLAAFGGIVAFSRGVDAATARLMAEGERFLEVVVAESFDDEAVRILGERWKNVRLLPVGATRHALAGAMALRSVPGGLLVQERDAKPIDPRAFTQAAGPAPNARMLAGAGFAFTVAKHLKSNAVCIGAGGRLFGAGAGQMDRVASCRNAVEKARAAMAAMPAGQAAVAASDAFFPFADGPTLLADAGVRCIVHPGGSKRDQDTFDLCNARGITCLLTGTRHFRH
jgi:phosphoribosylaminoimidazolecarboxamide formyltransferase/IMP cyclohydrolase